jgi:hypothetical protein
MVGDFAWFILLLLAPYRYEVVGVTRKFFGVTVDGDFLLAVRSGVVPLFTFLLALRFPVLIEAS